MTKLAAVLMSLSLSASAQLVTNVRSATAGSTSPSVFVNGFIVQTPGDSCAIWSTSMSQPGATVEAHDNSQSYPLATISFADVTGAGALFLLGNCQPDGAIVVTWHKAPGGNSTSPISPTAIVFELPALTGQLLAPVLSHGNFIYSLDSGVLPSQWGLHVYCVEAGLSRMIPFTPGSGYYLVDNGPGQQSFVQPGACQFEDSGNDTQTTMSWPIDAFHVSSVYLAVY